MLLFFLQSPVSGADGIPYYLVAVVVGALVSVIVYQAREIKQLNEQRRTESMEATKAAIATAEANRAQAEASERSTQVLNRALDFVERVGGLQK